MPPTIEHAALRYLDQWLLHELPLRNRLLCSTGHERLAPLAEALCFFGVSRNLCVEFDVQRGLPRFAPVLDALDAIEAFVTPDRHFTLVVENLATSLGQAYGRTSLVSLASKLLWLHYGDPFIIYDSRVRGALGCPANDYPTYASTWQAQYTSDAQTVAIACAKLPAARLFLRGADRINESDLAVLATELWFQHRVFDIYLWCRSA